VRDILSGCGRRMFCTLRVALLIITLHPRAHPARAGAFVTKRYSAVSSRRSLASLPLGTWHASDCTHSATSARTFFSSVFDAAV